MVSSKRGHPRGLNNTERATIRLGVDPLKLTGADVRETDHLLEENRLEIKAKGMPWDAISWSIDFEVSGKTLQRTMRDALICSKYLSALKEHLPERLMQKREKWVRDMYAEHPKPEDWKNIRFSDEVYAGYSPEGHLWIARKRGTAMRYRRDNIQHQDPPPAKEGIDYIDRTGARC